MRLAVGIPSWNRKLLINNLEHNDVSNAKISRAIDSMTRQD